MKLGGLYNIINMYIKHTVLPNLRAIKTDLILESILNNEESSKYENVDIPKLSQDLELVCYNYALLEIYPSTDGLCDPVCEEIYHLKIARIIGFFANEDNFKRLFGKIINKEILISELPNVNVADLFPEKYVHQLARINETGKELPLKYSSLYHCGKCKQNKCSVRSAQTRSLDECNTIFVNCLMCGNSFTV